MAIEYRLKREKERIGDLEFWVESLEDLDATIDELFAEIERGGDSVLLEELCPYFGRLWPSARALASMLFESREELRGKRVLELGCGLGLPSLLCARLGAHVVATDFHPEVPVFLERNRAANSIPSESLRYVRVDWRSGFPELGLPFDWVIGSDVLYERQHAAHLPLVLDRYLAPSGVAAVADPARPYLQPFIEEAQKLGFSQETHVRVARDGLVSKEVFLVLLRRPRCGSPA